MKNSKLFKSLTVAACLLPALSHAQLYTEGFAAGGSTINSGTPAAPTATSTAYQVVSTKSSNPPVSDLLASSLRIGSPATSAGLTEVQALFPSVTLGIGNFVNLEFTFVANEVMNGTGTQTLNVSLLNSGGVGPIAGGALGGGLLGTADATYATGGAQNWMGYNARIGNTSGTGSTGLLTRDAQSGATNNEAQDVVFGEGVTGGYGDPDPVSLANQTGVGVGVDLINTQTYTLTLNISYDGTDILVAQNLYDGTGTGGTNLISTTGQDLAAGGVYTTFDALGIGFRASAASNITISSLKITTNVPEPSTFAMLLGGAGLIGLVRRRRRA